MSVLGKMADDLKALAEASTYLPQLPVVVRRKGEILNDLEARLRSFAICIFIMPVLPLVPHPGAPFVFFQQGEVRLRAIENRKLNKTDIDVYEIAEGICLTFQGVNPGDVLAAPLQLSNLELMEDAEGVALDCIFRAAFQLNK